MKKTNRPNGENLKYVVAVVAMAFMGVAAAVIITLNRPDEDNMLLVLGVFAFLSPTIVAVLTFMKSHETLKKAEQTHLSVNSRLDEFKKAIEDIADARVLAALKKGEEIGRKEERSREED